MAQTNINIRMEEELKHSMESLCQELGLNLTTAVTIFFKKAVRERGLPFQVSIDPSYSETNQLRVEREQSATDEDVSAISQRFIAKNRRAYEELAK